MNITIANISTKISNQDLQAAVNAIEEQITQHFEPEWGISGELNGVMASISDRKARIQGIHDAVIYLGDSSQDPTTGVKGALGYHSDNYENMPYGFIYLDICAEYGEVWTCTLSHEVLELLADPTAVTTITGPAPGDSSNTVYYDKEVCDPTQGDSYPIGDITVSNFVGKSYFGLIGGTGKTNYLNLPLTPFGVRPGGYFQYEDAQGSHQIQGKQVTAQQLAAKSKMGEGRRNARRAHRSLRGSIKMDVSQPAKSLKEILASDPALRRKAQQAAAQAAYKVVDDAGVKITDADVAEAQADFMALAGTAAPIQADTNQNINTAANVVVAVSTAVMAGF